MTSVTWPAASDGRYWIDIDIGGMGLWCMVDLGIVDRLNRYGFELEPTINCGWRVA